MAFELGKKYIYVDGKFLPWATKSSANEVNLSISCGTNTMTTGIPDVSITSSGRNDYTLDFTTMNGTDGTDGHNPTITVLASTGNSASASWSEIQSGDTKDYTLNLTIPKGADGADGNAPVISFRSVTMLPSGSAPTSTWTKENGVWYYDLSIPMSSPGNTGTNGITPILSLGNVNTLEATEEPYAEMVDNGDGTATLNLDLPRGVTGDQGSDGKIAKLEMGTVTKGAVNATPTFTFVKKSGTTDNTYQLNCTLPIGQQGVSGLSGAEASVVTSLNVPNLILDYTENYRGTSGASGTSGITPKLVTGGTSTLSAFGSNPAVSWTSDGNNRKINVTMPAGMSGQRGVSGSNASTIINTDVPISLTAVGTKPSGSWTSNGRTFTLSLSVPSGQQGEAGLSGASGTVPSIAAGTMSRSAYNGTMSFSWTNNGNERKLNWTIPSGQQGETGLSGTSGAAGTVPKIVAGTMSRSAYNGNMTWTFTNDGFNRKMNWTIPSGQQGENGLSGTSGAAGTVPKIVAGTMSRVSYNGTMTWTFTNDGFNRKMNWGIPSGQQGETGLSGTSGASGVSPIISAGTMARSAYNGNMSFSWTSDNAQRKLNWTIPSGQQGEAGLSGTSGAVGTVPKIVAGTMSRVAYNGTMTWTFTNDGFNRKMNWGIPSGQQGETGLSGAAGSRYNIVKGTMSTVASTGTASAWFTSSGANLSLCLQLPQGYKGANKTGTAGTSRGLIISRTAFTATGNNCSWTLSNGNTACITLNSGANGANYTNTQVSNIISPTNSTGKKLAGSKAYELYHSAGLFNEMVKLTASGSWTAPCTGICKFIIIGAGGGGGGVAYNTATTNQIAWTAQGGAGGYATVIYEYVTKGSSYSYTIGAGGASGANTTGTTTPGDGGKGGNTSITINGTTYTGSGGTGGWKGTLAVVQGVSAMGCRSAGATKFSIVGTSKGFTKPGNVAYGRQSQPLWGPGKDSTEANLGCYSGNGGMNGDGWGIAGVKSYNTTATYRNPEQYSGAGGGGAIAVAANMSGVASMNNFQYGTPGAAGCIIIHYNTNLTA